MKKFRLIAAAALICTAFSNEGTWVIDGKSTLAIRGTTNLNSFICAINSYTGHDTLQYFTNMAASELQFTTNRMTIPIQSFDCGARQISKDFWQTLKSETYPKLNINFISLKSAVIKDNTCIKGVIQITLAGVTAQYNIRFRVNTKDGKVLLSGTHPVNFADFRLKAPEKLKGLIRVQNVLNVEFHLVLKAV